MIKFFRHIRQSLILENKTSKYFKYAIGEIVLVVIGILIALQINNWNESSKEKKVEQMYLKNILSDLKDQNASIDLQMEREQEYFEAAGYIIKAYQQINSLVIDSTFNKIAAILTARKTFIITDPTYTDLISSGNINILKSIEYKNKLIKYYQELEYIEKVILNNNSLLIDQNYLSAFNKIGYYYRPDVFGSYNATSKLNAQIVIPKYEKELQEISKKRIIIDENKLDFMNAVYLRNTVAIRHYELLVDLKTTTKSLVTELEQLLND